MIRAVVAEGRVFESWHDFQEALRRALAPLTEEQLSLRLVPGLRSVGEVAEHIVYARAKWLLHVLGEEAAVLEPFLRWTEPDDPPHTVAEVLHGLDLTWQIITSSLTRRAATDDIPDEEVPILQTIWGLLDHDLPHCGEISLLLGANGLPGVEI
jgi:hypothetical protein